MRAWREEWRGSGRSSASKADRRWEATMLIGIPREIKADEYRVGLIPSTAKELVARGHAVMVETLAGDGAGISDQEYAAAGAQIVASADQIFLRAALIVKVKEPLAAERSKLRRGQIIFTYLHLAADPKQTHDLIASGVTAIAYETVTDAAGKLPLLAPMSKIAGLSLLKALNVGETPGFLWLSEF
jgi:alanine dehydrogenase